MISDRVSTPRVRRDAWTRLLYLQLGAFAFFLYAFSPSLGFLRDDLHISAAVAGLHSTTYAVGVTLGGVTAPWYITRAGGSRPALWWGLVGLCASVALFCAVPVLAATLTAAAVCGVFGAWLCIAVPSALANAHGPATGPAAITEANAVAALIGLLAPLAVGGADSAGLGWRAALLGVAPLTAVLYLLAWRIREPAVGVGDLDQVVFEAVAASIADTPADTPADAPSGILPDTTVAAAPAATPPAAALIPAPRAATDPPAAAPAPSAPEPARDSWGSLSRRFWVNQVAGLCVAAIEFCLTLWCATLLHDRGHLTKSVAATGVTALMAGMAAGRSAGGWLALRFPVDRLLFAAFATNAAGFALFWASASPVAMFAGLAVAGLGMSIEYPLVSARGIELAEGRAELAGAVNMFGGGIAIGLAPFALGFLSDRIGIHAAYLLVPVFIAVAVTALAASRAPGAARRGPAAVPASETIAA